ncbi:MAG: hypothetical protein SOW36_02980, partial [Porphyromonas sp.]|nr:hypothetical protein [Porphyromonas sp.]
HLQLQPQVAIAQRQRQRITAPHSRAERHYQAGVHTGRSMGQLARQIASVALLATLASCAPRYIPVNHYIETERVKVERDSVHYTDTVRIAERGDTVLVEVVKWRTRYKTATDTLIRVDTVQLPPQLLAQPAPERQPWWRRWLTAIGAIVLVGAGAIAIYKLIRVLR